MMRLFLFELKKMLRQRKLLLLIAILIIAVLAVTVQSKFYGGAMQENALDDIRIYQDESRLLLKQAEERLSTMGHDESFQQAYENVKKMNGYIVEWEQAIVSEKWETIPVIEADFWESIRFHQSLKGQFNFLGNMERTMLIQQDKNKLLLEHNLPYEDERYSFTLPIFLFNSSLTILGLPFVLLLILLFGDIVTSEYEGRTNRLLWTQPLRYPKVILAKFMAIVSIIVFSIVVFIIFSTIASILFSKPINIWQYPIQISTTIIDAQIVPIYRTVGELFYATILSFLSVAIFLFSLHFVVSLLIQSRFIALCTSIVLFTTSYIVTINIEMLQSAWNPFYYLNIAQLIKNPETFATLWQLLWLWGYILILLIFVFVLGKNNRSQQKSVYMKPFKQSGFSINFLNVLQFEWRKLWRLGTFKYLTILLFALVLGGYFFITILTTQKEKDVLDFLELSKFELSSRMIPLYEEELMIQQRVINQLEGKEQLTDAEKFSKDFANAYIKQMTNSLENAKERLKELDITLQAYEEENWSMFYDYWIKQNELWGNINGNTGYINNLPTEQGGLSHFTYVASIEQKKRLADLNIKPVFAIEYLNTSYDKFIETKDQVNWILKTQQVEHTALFYGYLLFETYSYLFLLFLFMFVFGTGWLGELRGNKTVSLLKTQPITPSTLFLGKFTLQNLSALFFTLFTLSTMVIVSTIANRFGDWDFPVLKYGLSKANEGFPAFEGEFHFISMGNYVLQGIALFTLAALFIIVLTTFIASFVKNITLTSGVILILLVLSYAVSISQGFAHLSPFTYLNIPKVLNGELTVMLENPSISFDRGLITFVVSSFILIVVTFYVRKKK